MPAIQSMTGFARRERTYPWGTLGCEIRSVNHRYLELQLRLPDGLRHVETTARELLRERLGRGKVDCSLRLQGGGAASTGPRLDETVLQNLLQSCRRVDELAGGLPCPSALELLRWPGVLAEEAPDADMIAGEAFALLEETATELGVMRRREGERLAEFVAQRLAGVEALVDRVTSLLPGVLATQRQRLSERLAELLAQPPGDRLEQEIAMLAARADVAEELDRLRAHVAETRRSLAAGGACGRRLDFLMQEFNREANTLSSKSLSTECTQAAVDMKVLIEQMREQVQNIE